ncbi:hypothetical protein U1Q18_041730 [Sarracenia purpurea var. burkii]
MVQEELSAVKRLAVKMVAIKMLEPIWGDGARILRDLLWLWDPCDFGALSDIFSFPIPRSPLLSPCIFPVFFGLLLLRTRGALGGRGFLFAVLL